ncbi:hypothetical protein ACFVTP_33010, partial [Streptomyces celluloflavus]
NGRAAEIEHRAAETRRAAAEMERRALEAEDEARLTPSERNDRKIARLVLSEAGGSAEALPLDRIKDVLGVADSTASERRKKAAELIARGYNPYQTGQDATAGRLAPVG